MNDEMTLQCEYRNGLIVIGIGQKVLQFSAEFHPVLRDADNPDEPAVKITDAAVFAKEVVAQLNRESEAGSTLVTRMLDEAILAAVENGCEGVDHKV